MSEQLNMNLNSLTELYLIFLRFAKAGVRNLKAMIQYLKIEHTQLPNLCENYEVWYKLWNGKCLNHFWVTRVEFFFCPNLTLFNQYFDFNVISKIATFDFNPSYENFGSNIETWEVSMNKERFTTKKSEWEKELSLFGAN